MAVVDRLAYGRAWILVVDADPSGVTQAAVGSLAVLNAAPGTVWRNTDGSTTWAVMGGSTPTWRMDQIKPVTFSGGAGSYTEGVVFYVAAAEVCTGLQYTWNRGAYTVRSSIWNMDGTPTRLTYEDQVIAAGTQTVTVTFASPQTLTAGTKYAVSIWETTGAVYQTAVWSAPPARPFWLPPGKAFITSFQVFFAGDAAPTSSGSDTYPINPTFQ